MTNLEYLYRKGLVAFNHFTDGEWSIRHTFKHFKVIAWQPLPKPY